MELDNQPSRWRVVARRWYRVLVVAVGLVPAMLLLGRWQEERFSALVRLPNWYLFGPVTTALTLLLFVGWRRFLAFFGLKRTIYWPSYWIAGFIALGTSLLMVDNVDVLWRDFTVSDQQDTLLNQLGLSFISLPAVIVGVGLCAQAMLRISARVSLWWQSRKKSPPEAASAPSSLEIDALRVWLKDDEPIVTSSADLFDHVGIASRIATRLMQTPSSAQAVLGDLGAGKTSLHNLVVEQLNGQRANNVRLLRVSLWPFSEPRAAVEGIIGAIVTSLEHDVNTLGLRALPAEYGDAISKAGTVPSILAGLLARHHDPRDVLARANEIALSVGLHLVLWVEDLERFASGNPMLQDESRDEAAKLSPIRSLLYALDEMKSFTVISVTTSLLHRFDLEKISRYVERIPRVQRHEAIQVIAKFRRHWMKVFDDLDPERPDTRVTGWEHDLDPIWRSLLSSEAIGSLSDAVAELCRSPRALKQMLRRCDEAWSVLHGEVDLDELLAVVALRESMPDAFAIVDEMVPRFRHRGRNESATTDPFADCEKRLDTLNLTKTQLDAINFIVKYLFKNNRRYQSVAKVNHTDYWQRIVEQNEIPEQQRDQVVLLTLLSDDVTDILALLADFQQSRAVIDLAEVLSVPRAIALLPELVARTKPYSRRGPFGVATDRSPPGFVALWNVLLDKSKLENIDLPLLGAIEDCARRSVQDNPDLFIELEIMYASEWEQMGPLTREGLPLARGILRRIFGEAYIGKPKELARALARTSETALQLILFGQERTKRGDLTILFERWAELMPTVLDALKLDPDSMLPQIAYLVTSHNPLVNVSVLERTKCEAIFGDLRTLLASIPVHVKSDAIREQRSHALVAAAEQFRARAALIDVLHAILHHSKVNPTNGP